MYNHSENRLINYEEFCMLLIDDQKRVKFMPLVKFWGNIGTNKDNIFKAKIKKIQILLALLTLLSSSHIQE